MQKQSPFKLQCEGINPYKPQLDLKQLLTNTKYQARHLLAENNIVDQIKTNFKLFCSSACQRSDIIPDLVAFALRPDFNNTNNDDICKRNLPYISFQIISILAQSTFFHPFEKYPSQQSPSQFTFIDELFQTLSPQNQPNQTSLGYFANLINQIIYDQGFQLLQYIISNNTVIYSTMFRHINYTSVANILQSLLLIQDDNNAGQIFDRKKKLIEQLFVHLPTVSEEIIEDQIQNVGRLIQNLLSNLIDKKKLNCFEEDLIINLFVTKKNLSTLINLTMHTNDGVVTSTFDLINNLLRFQKELQKYPNPNRQSNQSEKINFPRTFQDRLTVWKELSECISTNLLNNIFYKNLPNSLNSKMRQSQLRLLLIIQNLVSLDKSFAVDIILPQFIKTNVELMDRHPFHNILHNCQKDILISALKFDLQFIVCHPDSGLIQFIIRSLKRIRRDIGFINQLFHIITQIQCARAYNFNFSDFMLQYGQWSSALQTYYVIQESYEQLLASENPVLQNQLDACTALSVSPPASLSRYSLSITYDLKKLHYRSQRDSFEHREDFLNNNGKRSKSPFSIYNNTKKKRHNTTQIDLSENILNDTGSISDIKALFPQTNENPKKKTSFSCDQIQFQLHQEEDQKLLKRNSGLELNIPFGNDDSFDANIENMSPTSIKHKAMTPTHNFMKNFEITEEQDNDYGFLEEDQDQLSISHRSKNKNQNQNRWMQFPTQQTSQNELQI